MKKYFILLSAAVLALSCAKELDDKQEVYNGEYKTVTFESVMTKTTLTENGNEGIVEWEAGDQISVYYVVDGVAKEAVATASAAGETATFTTQIPIEDNPTEYYAAYPAGSGVLEVAETATNFYVFVKPDAAAGTFKSVNYSAAYTTAEDKAFQFHNAVGMIRLAVPEGGKFTKDGVEYTLTGVYMRGQASAFDFADASDNKTGYTNTGLISFSSTGEFGERAIKSQEIGGKPYSGAANINMIKLSADALNSGYVYIPTAPGTWPTGLCVRYIATCESEEKPFALPAVLSNGTSISIERGEILKLGDLTEKVVLNYYVSSTREGNGLTDGTPMSFAKMQEMFDRTDDGIFGAYTLQRVTFNILDGTHILTSTIKIPKASAAYSATIKGAGATKTKLDGNSTVGVMSISDNTHIYLQDLTIQNGKAANGGGLALSLSGTTTDTSFILDCDNCIFSSNVATDFGGALFVNTGARGGLARFNNCSFTGNTAGSHSYILGTSNGTTAFMFNKCLLKKTAQKADTEAAKNGILIYLNNVNARLAMNNCTVNVNNGAYGNGGGIVSKGYTVIANSTVWSSGDFGKWGTITLGAGADAAENGAKIINSFVKNGDATSTTYPAIYFNSSYYQNVMYTFYTRSANTPKGGGIQDNCKDVSTQLVYTSSANVSDEINGVKLEAYELSWASNETAFAGYECTNLATVKSEIESTDVVGEIFVDWLETIPNSLTTDIFGNERAEDATCPGSYQFEDTPVSN